MSRDIIVEEVRRIRDKLVKRYGGLDGWIAHLQEMDRERARKTKRRTRTRKTRSPTGSPPRKAGE